MKADSTMYLDIARRRLRERFLEAIKYQDFLLRKAVANELKCSETSVYNCLYRTTKYQDINFATRILLCLEKHIEERKQLLNQLIK